MWKLNDADDDDADDWQRTNLDQKSGSNAPKKQNHNIWMLIRIFNSTILTYIVVYKCTIVYLILEINLKPKIQSYTCNGRTKYQLDTHTCNL